MYQQIYNAPSYSFVIQLTRPDGAVVQYQRIDQYIKPPCYEREVERVAGQVAKQIEAQSRRTGLNYNIIAAGPVLEVDRIIKRSNIIID